MSVEQLDLLACRPAVRVLERVICGCGRPTGQYGHRTGIIHYLAPCVFGNTEPGEAVRLLDHTGLVRHRCMSRSWAKGARFHLESEET